MCKLSDFKFGDHIIQIMIQIMIMIKFKLHWEK